MTIFKNRCKDAKPEDIDAVQFALQYGHPGGDIAVLERLRRVYPNVELYRRDTDNGFFWVQLDGTSHGRSVYVETVVRTAERDPTE